MRLGHWIKIHSRSFPIWQCASMVLAFALGIIAALIKSDLKIPPEIYSALTIYLLFAIGLKGGAKLVGVEFSDVGPSMLAALALSLLIPFWSFAILTKLGKFDNTNAAALAAHYGSVSAVTFAEALAFPINPIPRNHVARRLP